MDIDFFDTPAKIFRSYRDITQFNLDIETRLLSHPNFGYTYHPSDYTSGVTIYPGSGSGAYLKITRNKRDGRNRHRERILDRYPVRGTPYCNHRCIRALKMTCCEQAVCAPCYQDSVAYKACRACGGHTDNNRCPAATVDGLPIPIDKLFSVLTWRRDPDRSTSNVYHNSTGRRPSIPDILTGFHLNLPYNEWLEFCRDDVVRHFLTVHDLFDRLGVPRPTTQHRQVVQHPADRRPPTPHPYPDSPASTLPPDSPLPRLENDSEWEGGDEKAPDNNVRINGRTAEETKAISYEQFDAAIYNPYAGIIAEETRAVPGLLSQIDSLFAPQRWLEVQLEVKCNPQTGTYTSTGGIQVCNRLPYEVESTNPEVVLPIENCHICDEDAKSPSTCVMECCRKSLCARCYTQTAARRASSKRCPICLKDCQGRIPPLRLRPLVPVYRPQLEVSTKQKIEICPQEEPSISSKRPRSPVYGGVEDVPELLGEIMADFARDYLAKRRK